MPSTESTGGPNAVEHTARPGGLTQLDFASASFRLGLVVAVGS